MADNPFYRFYRHVAFPLSWKIYSKMPRHPCFKHEYWDGALHWTPRPHSCSVFLNLAAWRPPAPSSRPRTDSSEIRVRRLSEPDWPLLPPVFCAAFAHWPPLSQWEGPAPLRASRCIIEWARRGRDGPLVAEACVVAQSCDPGENEAEPLVGAALVTQAPARRPRDESASQDARLPHLTWIFVPWWEQRRRVATRLLGAVVEELRRLGHDTLGSTVLTSNEASMLWHWRHGFQLRDDR